MKRRILQLLLPAILICSLFSPASLAQESPANGMIPQVFPVEEHEQLLERLQTVQPAEEYAHLLSSDAYTWHDRLLLTPDGMNLYRVLEEASDNDGFNDFLIEDQYYDTNQPMDNFMEAQLGDFLHFSLGETETATGILTHKLPYGGNTNRTEEETTNLVCSEIQMCHTAFLEDHPHIFWPFLCQFAAAADSNAQEIYGFLLLKVDSPHPDKQFDYRDIYAGEALLREKIALRDASIDAILQEAAFTPQTTDLEKVRFFNSWLLLHNEYNTSEQEYPSLSHNSLNALVGSFGEEGPVCEGFSEAFKVLCDRSNVTCLLDEGPAYYASLETGELISAGYHMWNNVRLDGEWYGIDVTWNDDTRKSDTVIPDHLYEKFFLVGSGTHQNWSSEKAHYAFSETHVADDWGALMQKRPNISPTMYPGAHHLERVVETAPTCTEPGVQTASCKDCAGFSFLTQDREILPPLGHDWTWASDETGFYRVCSRDPSHRLEPVSIKSLLLNGAEQNTVPSEMLSIEASIAGISPDISLNVLLSGYDESGRMCYFAAGTAADSAPAVFQADNRSGEIRTLKCMVFPTDSWTPLAQAKSIGG